MASAYAIISLGCSKNLVDSEIMVAHLEQAGFGPKVEPEQADVLVINTCGFIDPAKQEAIDTIIASGRAREAGESPAHQKIIVTGCLAQRYAKDLVDSLPEVNAFVGLDFICDIARIAQDCLDEQSQGIYSSPKSKFVPDCQTPRKGLTPSHLAYIKIAEGCNHACAYCVIPRIRGIHRSRTQADILQEAKAHIQAGVKEITLIAQDTTYFGMEKWKKRAQKTSGVDSRQGESLASLLRELNALEGEFWIRVLYTHPAHWSDELIDTFAQCDKVVKYVDIPLQHISDDILAAQRRMTDGQYIRELLDKLRARVEGIGLRTTFISGLPGETEEQHIELKDFVREYRFERSGVFPYSKEEDSLAARMENQIHHATKKRRANEINMIQSGIADDMGQDMIGKTLRVLVDEPGLARGAWDAPDVDGCIHVDVNLPVGEFADVEIVDAIAYELFASGSEE